MPKTLTFFVLLFSLTISAKGQAFQGGVAGGLVGSQVAGDTYSGFHKPGAYAAFWVRLSVSEKSGFQTEISYFQKGSRHNPDEKKEDYTFYLMRLGYIEMPFLYQYHTKNKLTIEAGPSVSFLLHNYEEVDYVEFVDGDYNLINPSIMIGFGYEITEHLSANFRTVNSLSSIRHDVVTGAVHRFFDHGQYNDCLLLFLSYKF